MRFVKTYNDFKLDCKLELKPGTITALIVVMALVRQLYLSCILV